MNDLARQLLALREQVPRRGLVILCSGRSGSTLLCDDMRRTDVLGRPQEYLWHVGPSAGLEQVLDGLVKSLKRGCSANGLYAIKLPASHAMRVEAIWSHHVGTKPALFGSESLVYRIWGHLTFVRLQRNLIDQLTSQWRASVTGVWHTLEREATWIRAPLAQDVHAEFDSDVVSHRDRIPVLTENLLRETLYTDSFLRLSSVSHLTLDYDDIARDASYIDAVADAVGIRVSRPLDGSRTLRKLPEGNSLELRKIVAEEAIAVLMRASATS